MFDRARNAALTRAREIILIARAGVAARSVYNQVQDSLTRTDPSERSSRTGSRDQRQALVGKNVRATTPHEVSAASFSGGSWMAPPPLIPSGGSSNQERLVAVTAVRRTFVGDLPTVWARQVVVRGWVSRLRVLAKTTFVIVRDCTGEVQCVAADGHAARSATEGRRCDRGAGYDSPGRPGPRRHRDRHRPSAQC